MSNLSAMAPVANARWRRLTEHRAGAKSVFHFDVQGSVAKSTHAGLPWLRYIRSRAPGVYFLAVRRLGRPGGTFSRSRSLPVPFEQRLREGESGWRST